MYFTADIFSDSLPISRRFLGALQKERESDRDLELDTKKKRSGSSDVVPQRWTSQAWAEDPSRIRGDVRRLTCRAEEMDGVFRGEPLCPGRKKRNYEEKEAYPGKTR